MPATALRLGTRGSPLALAQAHEVRDRLAKAHGLAPDLIEISVIKTSGDRILDRPLAEIGGKGLFTKEIEEALLANEIDLAVHSMKDMQTALPDGLRIGAVLEREDVRDAFISLKYPNLDAVPQGATVGTSSLRRQAQLLNTRPDLKVVGFRGNVQTRLKKLEDGVAEATFLAVAGLKRLGMADRITQLLPLEQSIPACAQGVLGLETRAQDFLTAELIRRALHDPAEERRVAAERSFLARMGGSCQTPLAAHAIDRTPGTPSDGIRVIGMCGMPDGSKILRAEVGGPAADAELLGQRLAEDLLAQGAAEILAATKD